MILGLWYNTGVLSKGEKMPVKKKVVKNQKQQKMVDFGTAITRFWTNYVNFNGTAQRSEYWFWWLFCWLVSLFFVLVGKISLDVCEFLQCVWFVATLIPGLALISRRFHDAGFSAKWFWIPLVCMLGGFMWFVFAGLFTAFVYVSLVSEFYGALLLSLGFPFFGFFVFWFVVTLLPSKFEDNPYRE